MMPVRSGLALLAAAAAFCSLAVWAQPAAALYAEIDLQEVPIDRLVANMKRRAEQNPRDAEAQHQLARIHAMAYSAKRDSLIVVPGSGALWSQETHVPFMAQCYQQSEPRELAAPEIDLQPGQGKPPAPPVEKKPEAARWRGSHPGGEPKVQTTDDPQKQAAAKEQLAQAITHYRKAAELAPDNLTIALGLAWFLDQAGRKEEATAGYRRVIQRGWEQEQKLLPHAEKAGDGEVVTFGAPVGLGWHSVTAEAAGYLLSHLDTQKDAAEIATLKDRIDKLQRVNRAVTPLAIPLDSTSKIEDLIDRKARVRFDADGSERAKTWTWITPRAGWLVLDRNRTGQIRSALQLFGSVSYWCFWRDGYEALAALDDNGDGELAGQELRDLAVWRDANSNGVSDPGEVQPLAFWGIVALSCRGVSASPQDRAMYCSWSADGVRFEDGSTRPTFDVVLRRSMLPSYDELRH